MTEQPTDKKKKAKKIEPPTVTRSRTPRARSQLPLLTRSVRSLVSQTFVMLGGAAYTEAEYTAVQSGKRELSRDLDAFNAAIKSAKRIRIDDLTALHTRGGRGSGSSSTDLPVCVLALEHARTSCHDVRTESRAVRFEKHPRTGPKHRYMLEKSKVADNSIHTGESAVAGA